MRFENYVPERVGGAGKNKDVRRRIRGSQFRAPEITGKKRLGQRFRERFGLRAMTDDKKLNRQSFFAQTAISISQKVEIFFS